MTAPLHPPSATLRQDAGNSRAGVLSKVLAFWLSDRMLLIGITGFLAGYLVMVNAEMQLIWLAATCHPAFLANCLRTKGDGMTRDPLLRVAAAFLLWNLLVGVVRNHDAFAVPYTGEFFTGSLMLPVYLGGLWLVCRMQHGTRRILQALMWSGILAVAVGLIYWRFWQVVENPGARLRNLLVHRGQHPVSTAMCLSFAILATVACYWNMRSKAERAAALVALAVMMLAVMLTLSRGALLALLCVPLAFLAAMAGAALRSLVRKQPAMPSMAPYRNALIRSWPPMAVLGAVGVWFIFYGGILAPEAPPRPSDIPPDVEVIQLEKLSSSPLEEYFARETSGRTTIYRMGLSQMDTPGKWLAGAGLWGPEIELQRLTGLELGSSGINHFHSLLLATYIHGGIIGCTLFLTLLIFGFRRALALVRAGQPQWLAMLAFGTGALVMDGQSMCSLVTHPRFESFILWFPLVGAAAAWSRIQTAGRQPSSSESR